MCVPASGHIAAASRHIGVLRQSQTLPVLMHIQIVLLLTPLAACPPVLANLLLFLQWALSRRMARSGLAAAGVVAAWCLAPCTPWKMC